jgi:hypothetical protein
LIHGKKYGSHSKIFHLAFGMTALIKTLSRENLGKKRITDGKNFVHEIV